MALDYKRPTKQLENELAFARNEIGEAARLGFRRPASWGSRGDRMGVGSRARIASESSGAAQPGLACPAHGSRVGRRD